jgi:hypothetical protein
MYTFSAMKLLIALALLALVIPVHGQEERPEAASTEDKAKATSDSASPTQQVVSVVSQPDSNAQDNRARSHPQGYFVRLFSPENLPSMGLLIAGIVGIGIATRTLNAIKEQANLMKAAYRQWLRIENWRADEPMIAEGAELALAEIRFDILNPTKFPLTIRMITVQRQDITLPPTSLYTNKCLAPDERYWGSTRVSFERKAIESYVEGRGKLFAMIGVRIGFNDVLGDWQEDTFGRYCWMSKTSGNSFDPYEPGVLPDTEPKGSDNQHPN